MAKGKAQKRQRIEDLTTDEFLQHGLDSDVSDVDEEDNRPRKALPKKMDEPLLVTQSERPVKSAHKDQLESLKGKDPDFYNFLLQNDRKLLEFDESDSDGDYSDEEGLESGDENKDDEGLDDEEVENGEDEDNGASKSSQVKKIIVTKKMIDEWKQKLEKDKSVKTMRQVMSAFHCAVISIVKQSSEDQGKAHNRLQYSTDSNDSGCPFFYEDDSFASTSGDTAVPPQRTAKTTASAIPKLAHNKRKHAEKSNSQDQEDTLLLKAAEEDFDSQKEMLAAMKDINKSLSESTASITSSINNLGTNMMEGMKMIAMAFSTSPPQPNPSYFPQMPYSFTSNPNYNQQQHPAYYGTQQPLGHQYVGPYTSSPRPPGEVNFADSRTNAPPSKIF